MNRFNAPRCYAGRLGSIHLGFPLRLTSRAAIVGLATVCAGASLCCSFPDHRFGDENCLNGVDDDGNGFADCDDPACNSQVACVPPVPSGWQGPVAIWKGAGSELPPKCSDSGYSLAQYQQLFDDPESAPEICPICDCTGTPTSGASHCFTRVQLSDVSQCGGSRQLMTGPDGAAGFVVGDNCTPVPVSNQFSPQSAFFAATYAVDDICTPHSTNQAVIPAPTYDSSLRACELSPSDTRPAGCSSSQQMCVPRPQGGYSSAVCIFQESGSVSCPGPFDEKYVFSLYDDKRQCSECGCTATGISCQSVSTANQMYVGSYDDSLCSSTPLQIVSQDTGCVTHPFATGVSVYMKLINATPQATTGTPSCQSIASKITGSVTPRQSVTFCCLNL